MTQLLRSLAFIVAMLVAAGARAQPIDCPEWATLIDALAAGRDARAAITLTDAGQNTNCYARFLSGAIRNERSAFAEAIERFEAARSDKQAGASASGSGSTAIVSQGPTAKVLSVAAEYGGMTQSAKDGVVTVRGNLAGLPSALVQRDVFPYCPGNPDPSGFCVDHSLLSLLRHVSFGVSFDPSRAQALTGTPAAPATDGSQAVTFTGSQGEIAAINVRVELVNHRDAASADFRKAWQDTVGTALDEVTGELIRAADVIVALTDLPEYDRWRSSATSALQQSGRDRARIEDAFRQSLAQLAVIARTLPDADTRLMALRVAFSRYFLAQDELIDSLAEKHVLALEYTQHRPLAQPRTSNVRVILDYPLSKETKLVSNAALTFYDTAPTDPAVGGRLRDVQVGVQMDKGLGDSAIGPAVFSLAGYFQYQRAASILEVDPATPLPGVSFTGLPAGTNESSPRPATSGWRKQSCP